MQAGQLFAFRFIHVVAQGNTDTGRYMQEALVLSYKHENILSQRLHTADLLKELFL